MTHSSRYRFVVAMLACAAGASGLLGARQQASAVSHVVAFVGVNIVPMDTERVLDNQTLVVRDGRIVALGPASSVAVPANARVIEGSGKYLMPGLADMHAHLPPFPGDAGDAADIQMQLYLANGVTTVRGMMGHPAHLTLRDRITRGERTGPAIVAGSPPVHGKNAPDPAAAEKMIADLKSQGFDLVKVWEGLSPDAYATITSTARRIAIPIAGHVTATVGLERALAARQSSIEHLDGYLQALVPVDAPVQPPPGQLVLGPVQKHIDESRMRGLAQATKAAGVYNTPTLALFRIVMSEDPVDAFLKWPEMRYVSPGAQKQFAAQKAGTYDIPAPAAERQRYLELRDRMARTLAENGAPLLIGPDSPQMFLVPGFATHREIRSFRAAGISSFAALSAATRNAAAYLGKEAEFGTVATGKRADLLLLDGNPLADLANLDTRAGVMVRGAWLPAADLQRMLDGIAALHASASAK
jgi:hypothetical protein